MILTPIAYATLHESARIARLAWRLREQERGNITKAGALRLVQSIQGRSSNRLAERIYTEAHRQQDIARKRKKNSYTSEIDWGAQNLRYRLTTLVIARVLACYDQCGFAAARNTAHERWVYIIDPHEVEKQPGVQCAAKRYSRSHRRPRGGVATEHTIYVRSSWRRDVLIPVGGVVDGCLIVDAGRIVRDAIGRLGTRVTYVRQGRGTTVETRTGTVWWDGNKHFLKGD